MDGLKLMASTLSTDLEAVPCATDSVNTEGPKKESKRTTWQNITPWTDAILARLREYYDAGLSHSVMATQINNEFGTVFTRNSMIGKCNRDAFPPRRHDRPGRPRRNGHKDRSQTQRIRLRAAQATPARQLREEPVFTGHLGLNLLDVQQHECLYPHGTESYTFCGQPSQEGSSYCGHHHRLCYYRPNKPNRSMAA